MSEMVDRAARAAYEACMEAYAAANMLPPALKAIVREIRWDDLNEQDQNHWRIMTRAVIAAMRLPTDDMLDACAKLHGKRCNDPVSARTLAIDIWQVMIDAAPSE